MKLSLVLIAILTFMSACAPVGKQTDSATEQKTKPAVKFHKVQPHGRISSWTYVLQHPPIAQLAESPYNLMVVDYSQDGTDNKRFAAKDISLLHKFNKTVLCYFSIGEAEDYRFYWEKEWKENPPKFLGPENPDWAGNYKTKYWREDWWEQALKPYLDRILEAGFDGVYLDIVDAYWYWHEQGKEVRYAADDMVKLILRIAAYARKKAGPNFIVAPQNGLGILYDSSPEYRKVLLKSVEMFGIESLFYNYYSKEDHKYRLKLAKELSDERITVLNVEYIKKDQYQEYMDKIKNTDFKIIPYASTPDAALDKMTDFYTVFKKK